jgi:ubiquinone/menaquinone biosynthesis C-methylase UbiE
MTFMNYIIENQKESSRLKQQNALPQYSVEDEINLLNLDLNGKCVLDAGCGVGTLAKIIRSKFHAKVSGCDASELRIKEAKKESKGLIDFFVADLTTLPFDEAQFDVIFIRFVLEHTLSPRNIIHEAMRVLKPGGMLVIIDLDGLIFNLHHENSSLKDQLNKLLNDLPIDLFIGRKLPRMVSECGLKLSECHVIPMLFRGTELDREIDNMIMRFNQSESVIKKIIGDDSFHDFKTNYIFEMKKSEIHVCNKFIITATKNERQ